MSAHLQAATNINQATNKAEMHILLAATGYRVMLKFMSAQKEILVVEKIPDFKPTEQQVSLLKPCCGGK